MATNLKSNDTTPKGRVRTNTSSYTRTEGLRRRIFARFWEVLDASVDQQIAVAKDDVLSNIEGPIVEIGAGHGSNFCRYAPGSRVTAFEPNAYMAAKLKEAAQHTRIDLDLRIQDLRDAALESNSVPTVVSVLTLCSVDDRTDLIDEIHRVLTPGGRFIFIEHVAETTNHRRRRFQRLSRPLWRAIADGCDPSATTDCDIEAAGFSSIDAVTENLGPGLDPTNLNHWGVAVK